MAANVQPQIAAYVLMMPERRLDEHARLVESSMIVNSGCDLTQLFNDPRGKSLSKTTPTATVQLDGPSDSMGRDLHIEESCDHLVAMLLLLMFPAAVHS